MRLRAAVPLARSGLTDALSHIQGTVEPMPSALRLMPAHVEAVTIGSRVFVRPDRFDDLANGRAATLLAHELVHVRQWQELGGLRFLVQYVSEYLWLRLIGCDHDTAYRNISFEWEAYSAADRIVSAR